MQLPMQMIQLPQDTVITPELVNQLIIYHQANNLPRLKKLQNYYEARHEILNRQSKDPSKPNNKLVNPFPAYIVNTVQGFFLGKPVTYMIPDPAYQEKLSLIFYMNDEGSINSLHGKQAGVKGLSAELIYMDENSQVRFSYLDVNHLVPVFDTKVEPSLLFVIRYYEVKDFLTGIGSLYVEVYTNQETIYYQRDLQKDQTLTEVNRVPHYFGEVPVVLYFNSDEAMGDFERVLPLIDAYDKIQSFTADEMEYFADAYLALTGMQETQPEDIQDMKQNRVLLIPEGGSADFIVKKADIHTIEAYKKRLEDDIHKFSSIPNLNDEKFGNQTSGIAIKYKLFGLEQVISIKERLFKESLQRRLRLITNILNIQGGNYNYTDVVIHFHRNEPVNVLEMAQLVQMLYGITSKETLLGLLPFVEDVKDELDRMATENDGNDYGFDDPLPEIQDQPSQSDQPSQQG